jgi:hypothetical protein
MLALSRYRPKQKCPKALWMLLKQLWTGQVSQEHIWPVSPLAAGWHWSSLDVVGR